MPCRRGCSPQRPGPVCCCARRCSGRHMPYRNGEHFCTADTCSNPEFCLTFRPQFCPNAPTDREHPDAESPQFGRWPPPPPFPDISTPWPPTSPHSHPQSSSPDHLQSHHSISSLHSVFAPPASGNQQPYSTQSGSPVRRKSTARLAMGKPSLTRLDSGHNQTGLTRPDSGGPMRQRLASMGRPSMTPLDGSAVPANHGCWQTDRCIFGGSHRSPNGAGVRYSEPAPRYPPRGSRPQPIGRFQQAQQGNGNGFGSDSAEREGRCECRMPPAFAGYRCTGNLGGFCDCPHCDHNK